MTDRSSSKLKDEHYEYIDYNGLSSAITLLYSTLLSPKVLVLYKSKRWLRVARYTDLIISLRVLYFHIVAAVTTQTIFDSWRHGARHSTRLVGSIRGRDSSLKAETRQPGTTTA